VIISLADPDGFRAHYDATLTRIRAERPSTVDSVAAILSDNQPFQPPLIGIAKFGNYADDRLYDALADVGWQLRFLERAELWDARHPATDEEMHYVKGDVYRGPWADPGSAQYARDYDNGWRTARRNHAHLSVGDPVGRPARRNVSRAWRDGFDDQAADHPKWTWRQARLAGWDNTGNYEFALFCGQEWAQKLGGPPTHGSARQQATDALSAFLDLPSEANLHTLNAAMGAMREAGLLAAGAASPGRGVGKTAAAAASLIGRPAAVGTDQPAFPVANPLAPSRPASEPARRPRATRTAAAAETPRKRRR
jgi:hypothetical protein